MVTTTLIIFFTSLFATALSSMSGGGASVIIIPALLWLGVSFPMATAAQKFSSMFWVLPASYNYLHDRKIDWRFLFLYTTAGLIGVYLGFSVVLTINPAVAKPIIGVIILWLALYVLGSPKMGVQTSDSITSQKRLLSWLSAPFLGFYEVFFGSGNGILFSIVGIKSRGFDFISSLGYYYAIAFFWEVLAVGMFLRHGFADLSIIMPTVAGSLIGGWIGSRYGKYKGNVFIRYMFVTMATLIGTKLLFIR